MTAPRGSAPKIVALIIYIIVILVATPQAQQAPVSFSGSPGAIMAGPTAVPPIATDIDLLVGRSTILNVGSTIARVSLTVPDVADAMVTAPGQLLIHGKQPGTISLFVWDRAGGIKTYEVNVRRDLKQLGEQMAQLFPGEPIAVAGSGKDVVISGTVSSKYVIDKAADVAGGYVEKKENVVNLLKQVEGVASNQVMLQVRFAEVSRTAVQELGASLFTGGTGVKNVIARTTTQQFSAPDFTNLTRTATLDNTLTGSTGTFSLSDFLNLFIFSNKLNVGTVVRALQEKGLFQSLAEPNLIASNGKEASFLAGGEYPYPVAQPSAGGNAVTIQFKEFGVRLSFTPTVLGGDLINLKVKPEVSSLDFANAITLGGFRVPALSTRRTETEVELQDGQTFAIAGLLSNTASDTMRKIPGIGDVPILGWLFKSKAMQKQQTELVVMITPRIIRRGSTGVSEGLPAPVEPFLGKPARTLPVPEPYTGSPRYPANRSDKDAPKREERTPTPAPAVTPAIQTPAPAQPALASTTPATVLLQAPPTDRNAAPKPASMAKTKPSAPSKPSKAELKAAEKQKADALKAAEKQRVEDKKAADDAARQKVEQDRKDAEVQKIADQKAAVEKVRTDKLDKERSKREAIVAQRNAESERRKLEDQKKHDKALADAAERLRLAQAAYQAEVGKTSKGGGQ